MLYSLKLSILTTLIGMSRSLDGGTESRRWWKTGPYAEIEWTRELLERTDALVAQAGIATVIRAEGMTEKYGPYPHE